MGYLKRLGGSLKRIGKVIRKIITAGKAPPADLEHIEPHAPHKKFHEIANKFIDEYGFTKDNAKRYTRQVLKLPKAQLDARDRDIIADISP